MTLAAGKLRHKITIESVAETRDAMGDTVETWSTFATPWASFEYLRGDELFAAQQQHAEAIAKVIFRYEPDLTEKMRINFDGNLYNILYIDDWQYRHKEHHVTVSIGLRD